MPCAPLPLIDALASIKQHKLEIQIDKADINTNQLLYSPINFNLLIYELITVYLSTVDVTKAPDSLLLIQQFRLFLNFMNDHHVPIVSEQLISFHFNINS